MKTIKILLIAVIISVFGTNSQLFSSYLNISLVDNSNFTAIVDNLSFNQLTSVVEVSGIPGGSHYVKVMKQDAVGGNWSNIIFEGYVKIPENCNVYASIDEVGNFMMYKKLYADKQITQHNDEHYNIMNPRDFADFKKLIKDRTFESTKFDMTKSVIDNNLFSVDQVREILSWFVFESNKLELAKYAFKNTVDRNNYFKLYDIFVFESNVTDLDNYIKNFRN